MKVSKTSSNTLKIIAVVSVSIGALSALAQVPFAEPNANPANPNISKPIHTGGNQTKTGTIWLEGTTTPSFKFTDSPGPGKILTLGNDNFAFWANPPSGGSGPTGTGAENYVAKWSSATGLNSSLIYDNGTNVGIGTSTPTDKLHVEGGLLATQLCLPPGTNGGCISNWALGGGMANVMEQTGDMIYASANGNPAPPTRLGISPTNGHILKVSNGKPTWAAESAGGGSPWIKTGTNIHLSNNTYKVGIGTQSPAQQLQITGNFKMPESSTLSGNTPTAGFWLRAGQRFLSNFAGNNILLGRQSWTDNVGAISGKTDNIWLGGTDVTTDPGSVGNRNVSVGWKIPSSFAGDGTVRLPYITISTNTASAASKGVIIGRSDNIFTSSSDSNVFVGTTNENVVNLNADNFTAIGTAIGHSTVPWNNDFTNLTLLGRNAIGVGNNRMIIGNSLNPGGYVKAWGFGVQPRLGSSSEGITRCIAQIGTNTTNGNGACVTNQYAFEDASDISKKYNIKDTAYGLREILALRPASFLWNGDDEQDIGFIAQEVEKIIPELVHGEDGDKTLAYSHITVPLTKALQELSAKNEELKQELEFLEAEALRQGY